MIDVLEHQAFHKGETYTDFIERNMAGKEEDMVPVAEMAAAVSSTALLKQSSIASGGVAKATRPSPWQIIGVWEIGMRSGK